MIFPEYVSARDEDASTSPYLAHLAGRRIAIIATGALNAMYLPAWLHWLGIAAPTVSTRTVLTSSARGFVGLDALRAFSTTPPELDVWEESPRSARHIDLDDDVDAYVVHPATMSFVSRVCAGLCDSPTMLAIQGTGSPVIVAASAPPGFQEGPLWRRFEADLQSRPNIHLLPPQEGVSARDRTRTGSPPAPFPSVLEYLDAVFEGSDHVRR